MTQSANLSLQTFLWVLVKLFCWSIALSPCWSICGLETRVTNVRLASDKNLAHPLSYSWGCEAQSSLKLSWKIYNKTWLTYGESGVNWTSCTSCTLHLRLVGEVAHCTPSYDAHPWIHHTLTVITPHVSYRHFSKWSSHAGQLFTFCYAGQLFTFCCVPTTLLKISDKTFLTAITTTATTISTKPANLQWRLFVHDLW